VNKGPTQHEQELFEKIMEFKRDPLGYVMFAFPWGVAGTPLEKVARPRQWQVNEFIRIGEHCANNVMRMSIGLNPEPYYLAISSGRGPGKSAFLSMLEMWVMSCWPGATTIVTANTETQLRSRTMAELGKWHTMAINGHWFEKSSMSLRPARWFGDLLQEQLRIDTQYYYVDAQSWSEENPDAFAGAHSQIAMVVLYDEASGIPDSIWSVTEGFFTDLAELRIWAAISNPRRNSGRFFGCFHDNSGFWQTSYIDSRTVEGVDTGVYDRIAEQYGEDHDVTRIEVKGQFPRVGSNQFISSALVKEAQERQIVADLGESLIMGVDVARYGDDHTVCRFRRGRDAKSIKPVRWRGASLVESADRIAQLIDEFKPDAVCIDQGMGSGVIDILQSRRYRVHEIAFGSSSSQPEYANKRTEMYATLRDWLSGGCIDKDDLLYTDLTALEYKYHGQGRDKIVLEPKDELKKRIGRSPDEGDALVLTFAIRVSRKDGATARPKGTRIAAGIDESVFGG
jgi:hypothetical protein